jgi:hypothetical protein
MRWAARHESEKIRLASAGQVTHVFRSNSSDNLSVRKVQTPVRFDSPAGAGDAADFGLAFFG